MKTLTAYAAAVELDMGKTLDTQTYLEQSQDGTARLVLKGNGDMLLGAGASDANHINGRAGLGTLAGRTAQALRQRGITSVTLAYDDTLFGNDRWPQGIAELDTDHLYYARQLPWPWTAAGIGTGQVRPILMCSRRIRH